MFTPGRNIALKLPERVYAQTLAFYRDTLGLTLRWENADGAAFDFGGITLNLDRVPAQSQPDIWLEVFTPDTSAARSTLQDAGVTICDEVEPLPDGFDGFWMASPSGTVHLVSGPREPAP